MSYLIGERETELYQRLRNEAPEISFKRIGRAMRMAFENNGWHKHRSGIPLILHLLEVAHILLRYTKEEDIIVAGLLHDIIARNANVCPNVLIVCFGTRVGKMVDGITPLYWGTTRSLVLTKDETLRKVRLQEDWGCLLIKLAEHVHDVSTIGKLMSAKAYKNFIKEMEGFVLPLAQELGLKLELQQLNTLQRLVKASHDLIAHSEAGTL